MVKAIGLAVLAATLASAQITRTQFSPNLREYLELTEAQMTSITRLNLAFSQFQSQKAQRILQVQQELGLEMARPVLDPNAIGVRHIELEAIQREITAERVRTMAAIQALFTPAQKTKIEALQEVFRLYSLACEAVANNLTSGPTIPVLSPTPITPNPFFGSYASFLLGPATLPTCTSTVPSFRTGDFTFTPGPLTPVAP